MEKLDIIYEAERLLPDEIRQGNFHINGKVMPVEEYMETVLVNHLNENATPEYIAGIIRNKFISKITLGKTRQEKEKYIKNFIDGLDNFVETIHLGKGQYEDVRERLLGMAPFMDNDFNIVTGPVKRSLQEFYYRTISNNQEMLTLADKQEVCIAEIKRQQVELAVLESQMEGYEVPVEEYITEILPTLMISCDSADFNGTIIPIDEVIEKIVIRQKEILEEKERRKNGIPMYVGEIVQTTDGKYVSDTPYKPLEPLTTVEIDNSIKSYVEELSLNNDEIARVMNQLMDSIRNINTKEVYERLKKEVEDFKESIKGMELPEYLIVKQSAMTDMLDKKNIIIAKKDKLVEELEDYIYNIVNQIKSEAKRQGSQEAYNLAIGRIVSIKMDLKNIGCSDYQIEALLQSTENELRATQIKSSSVKTNESPEKSVLKSTIEVEYMNKFERDVQEAISYGGAAHLEGAVLRLEKEYEKIVIILKDLKSQNRLSNEEYQYFKSQIATSLKKLYASQFINNENKSLTAQLPIVETSQIPVIDEDNLLGLTEDSEEVTMKM